jgi:hypothetical protein
MPAVFVAPLGARVRCRPFLDAIGAQEHAEYVGSQKPTAVWGTSKMNAWEREQQTAGRRRNAAERKLRPDEAAAFAAWRAMDEGGREAVRAILTDLP